MERKKEHEKEASGEGMEVERDESWRTELSSLQDTLHSHMNPEALGSLLEELAWLQTRPSLERISLLLSSIPNPDTQDNHEKAIIENLKDSQSKVVNLVQEIEIIIERANKADLRSLWSRALELGVLF
jgi:hypothetical protein